MLAELLTELLGISLFGYISTRVAMAALTALKCPQELKGHVRGALNNGCTVEEIREALLHCAVYAGVPAAIDAFRAAQEAIDTWQGEQPACAQEPFAAA